MFLKCWVGLGREMNISGFFFYDLCDFSNREFLMFKLVYYNVYNSYMSKGRRKESESSVYYARLIIPRLTMTMEERKG